MRASTREELERMYRDKALADREDKSCGIVDDIEAEEVQPGLWLLTALLVGPGAWSRRRPYWLTALLPDKRVTRIDASDIASATSVVRLLKSAHDLGLGPLEQRLLRWLGVK